MSETDPLITKAGRSGGAVIKTGIIGYHPFPRDMRRNYKCIFLNKHDLYKHKCANFLFFLSAIS